MQNIQTRGPYKLNQNTRFMGGDTAREGGLVSWWTPGTAVQGSLLPLVSGSGISDFANFTSHQHEMHGMATPQKVEEYFIQSSTKSTAKWGVATSTVPWRCSMPTHLHFSLPYWSCKHHQINTAPVCYSYLALGSLMTTPMTEQSIDTITTSGFSLESAV